MLFRSRHDQAGVVVRHPPSAAISFSSPNPSIYLSTTPPPPSATITFIHQRDTTQPPLPAAPHCYSCPGPDRGPTVSDPSCGLPPAGAPEQTRSRAIVPIFCCYSAPDAHTVAPLPSSCAPCCCSSLLLAASLLPLPRCYSSSPTTLLLFLLFPTICCYIISFIEASTTLRSCNA